MSRPSSALPLVMHLTDVNNPHGDTKAQAGLSEMVDYPPATLADAINLRPVDKYLTLRTFVAALQALEKQVTVTGPSQLIVSTPGTYTITNFRPYLKYVLAPRSGTLTRSGAVLTYTPNTVGLYGFTVNKVDTPVTVIAAPPPPPSPPLPPAPQKPTITFPVDGSTLSAPFTFTADPFVGSTYTAAHGHTHWIVTGGPAGWSVPNAFKGDVDNVNLTSLAATAADLPPGTYSAMVMYGEGSGPGGGGEHSPYSDPISFTVV
jgi:hypothetical protein